MLWGTWGFLAQRASYCPGVLAHQCLDECLGMSMLLVAFSRPGAPTGVGVDRRAAVASSGHLRDLEGSQYLPCVCVCTHRCVHMCVCACLCLHPMITRGCPDSHRVWLPMIHPGTLMWVYLLACFPWHPKAGYFSHKCPGSLNLWVFAVFGLLVPLPL